MPLDAIDLRILRHLQQDGRMSNQDLAERVSSRHPCCLRRLRLLEKRGDHPRLLGGAGCRASGRGAGAIVHVSLRQDVEGWHEAFIARVRDWPEVVTAYVVTGATNYVLRVRARNLKHYSDFIVNKTEPRRRRHRYPLGNRPQEIKAVPTCSTW